MSRRRFLRFCCVDFGGNSTSSRQVHGACVVILKCQKKWHVTLFKLFGLII